VFICGQRVRERGLEDVSLGAGHMTVNIHGGNDGLVRLMGSTGTP